MRPTTRLVCTIAAAFALTVVSVSPAFALAVRFNTDATLTAKGVPAQVSGPIECKLGERVSIRVTLTQRRAGAAAQGRWRGACANSGQWTVARLGITAGKRFHQGKARACGLAVTRQAGEVTDVAQWCGSLRLRR